MFCNNIILYRFFNMNLNDLIRDNMEKTFVPAVRSKNSWHVTVIVNVAEASVWVYGIRRFLHHGPTAIPEACCSAR